MAKHMTRRFAAWSVVAILCAALDGLAVPAFCAESIVVEAQKAVETPTSGETQKPDGTEKADDAQKADETAQTGKTDESGEATEMKVDLTKLSLEELMNIEVTIASRTPETIMDTPSAVYVLTGEDIKESGATNIPDALRLVPGVEVANISANTWAVSIRGFNFIFANELLVMIDGRSIYTPQHSGVYWDVQDVVLEDVDRIEVVRGPGATMWGANAVNGVINIITKSSEDTQGNLVAGIGGSVVQDMAVVRHGGKMGKDGHFRVFGKYFTRGPFVNASGSDAGDKEHLAHGGFRMDWDVSSRDQMTLQGDIYDGNAHVSLATPSLSPPFQVIEDYHPLFAGWNILGRWTRASSSTSDTMLQVYFDQTRYTPISDIYRLNTFDIDFQQHTVPNRWHDVVWGLGYRLYSDNIKNTFVNSLYPPNLNWSLFSAFAQDEMTLIPNRSSLIVGSKFENYYFAGWQVEPSIRFLWTPDTRHSMWAAVSRAVRTPSRFLDEDGRSNLSVFPDPQDPNILYLVSVFGNPNVRPEELLAYELGYRAQATNRFSLDFAGFYNIYHHLMAAEMGMPFPEFNPPPPHVVIPLINGNNMQGQGYGFEIAANWRPRDKWQVDAGYTYLQLLLQSDQNSNTIVSPIIEGQDPHNQFFLRSSMNLTNKVQWDTILRYVDALPGVGVPSYFEMDMRFAWQATKNLEASLVGQNLLQNRHQEFSSPIIPVQSTEVPRSVYGTMTWTF